MLPEGRGDALAFDMPLIITAALPSSVLKLPTCSDAGCVSSGPV